MIKAPGFPGYFSDNGMVLWFQDVPGIAWISMSQYPGKKRMKRRTRMRRKRRHRFFLNGREPGVPWRVF